MIRVTVVGCAGRMGGEIIRLLSQQNDIELVGGVEVPGHPDIGKKAGSGVILDNLEGLISQTDVIVDFSTPESVINNIKLSVINHKPFITGVTGFTTEQIETLKDAGKQIPVVFAPNFSVGVAVLSVLVSQAAKFLGSGYDMHIIEIHHKKKKDAPSGTARLLVEEIKAEAGKVPVEVISIRTGDVVGEHQIIFGGPGERVELVHKAESRTAFAFGVISAIRWIRNQSAGFYSMADILNFKSSR
jgi:4-hydroxy-tetrahydrodipicolinate reductase